MNIDAVYQARIWSELRWPKLEIVNNETFECGFSRVLQISADDCKTLILKSFQPRANFLSTTQFQFDEKHSRKHLKMMEGTSEMKINELLSLFVHCDIKSTQDNSEFLQTFFAIAVRFNVFWSWVISWRIHWELSCKFNESNFFWSPQHVTEETWFCKEFRWKSPTQAKARTTQR